MMLQKIEIEQFGGLKNYSLELSSGFQYLYGENEAGKSTLCAFLSAMFYGLRKERGAGLRGDARSLYMPWDEKYMAGTLYFAAEGKNYVLKRRFGKTNRSDQTTLLLADTWQEVPVDPETLGQRFLGIGEDAFRKTLFIGQSGAAFSKGKEDELMERLLSLEQSGDEDASLQKALTELERASTELVTKTGRGGALVQQKSEIEKLQAELAAAKQKNLSFQGLLDDIKKLTAEKDMAEVSIAALEEKKKEARAFADYQVREQKRQSGRALQERKAAEEAALLQVQTTLSPLLAEQANLAGQYVPEPNVLIDLTQKEANCAILEEKEKQRMALQEEIVALQKEAEAKPAEKKNPAKVFLLALAALMAVLAVVGGVTVSPVSFVLLLLSAVFVFAAFRKQKDIAAEQAQVLVKLKLEEKQKQFEDMTKEDYAGQLAAVKAELAAVFAAAGVDTVKALSAETERKRSLFERVSDLKQEEARLKESLESLASTISRLTLPPSEETVCYDGPPVEQLEQELATARETQMGRERNLAQMNAKATEGFSTGRSMSVIETELEQAEELYQELSERYETIELARKALEECSEELKKTFAPALNEKSGALISRLTKGRYREIRVTDDYGIMLKTPDGHEIKEADYVSAGTFDLLYFALRISVLQTLFDEIPLLVLDDTFIQMDENRQREAFGLLREPVAKQILYFSCHKPQDKLDIPVHNL